MATRTIHREAPDEGDEPKRKKKAPRLVYRPMRPAGEPLPGDVKGIKATPFSPLLEVDDEKGPGSPPEFDGAMIDRKEETAKKKAEFLQAMEANLGIVSQACRNTGVTRATYTTWMREDDDFRRVIHEEISPQAVDYVEGKLFKAISKDDTSSIHFYLKSKARDRGYGNEVALTGAGGGPIAVDMTLSLPLLKEELSTDALSEIIDMIHSRKERLLRRPAPLPAKAKKKR